MARVDVDLNLRSHHMAYLRQMAGAEQFGISDALAAVINGTLQCASTSSKIAKQARAHVALSSEHLALIDRQALLLGVVRSDVVRRLIDSAIVRDTMPA